MKKILSFGLAVCLVLCALPGRAYAAATVSDGEVKAARDALLAAEQKVKDLQAQIDSGSKGFFEYVGAQDALAILNYRVSTQGSDTTWGKTDIGTAGDATSLENMKAAIDFIEEGNVWRRNDNVQTGLPDLLVTDAAMAAAQVRMNACYVSLNHSPWSIIGADRFDKLDATYESENLCWGYTEAVGGPYYGWYTEEKLVYDYLKKYPSHSVSDAVNYWRKNGYPFLQVNNTRHYEALISRKPNASGFAIVTKSGTLAGLGHGQLFITCRGGAYTVAAYRERFLNYYNKIYADLSKARSDLTAARNKVAALPLKLNGTKPLSGLKAAPAGKNAVRLSWNAVSWADGYLIYGKRGGSGAYGYIGMTTKGPSYLDTKALSKEYNFYWVYPYIKDANGTMHVGFSAPYAYAKGICPAVTGLKANSEIGYARIIWNKAAGAEGYLIYGKRGSSGKYGYIGMTTSGGSTQFLDRNALRTDWNYYWVFPYFTEDGRPILSGGKAVVGLGAGYTYARSK